MRTDAALRPSVWLRHGGGVGWYVLFQPTAMTDRHYGVKEQDFHNILNCEKTMKKAIFALIAVAAWAQGTYAQNTLKATIKEAEGGETLIGVTAKVEGTDITAVSDADR